MKNEKARLALVIFGICGILFSITLLFGDRKIIGVIGIVFYAFCIFVGFSKNLGKKTSSAHQKENSQEDATQKTPKAMMKKENGKKEIVNAQKAKTTISYIKHDSYKGKHLSYEYIADFTPVNLGAVRRLIEDTTLQTNHQFKWELGDGKVKLLYGGEYAGDLYFKFDMFSDYARRGDPVVVYLKKADDMAGEYEVEIAFFRDKEKQYQYREQTVVALTAYKSDDCQDIISSLEHGEEIKIEFDWDNERYIAVYGDRIGNIPSKIAKKLDEQEPVYVIFEKAIAVEEREDYTDIYEPYIRIYW